MRVTIEDLERMSRRPLIPKAPKGGIGSPPGGSNFSRPEHPVNVVIVNVDIK